MNIFGYGKIVNCKGKELLIDGALKNNEENIKYLNLTGELNINNVKIGDLQVEGCVKGERLEASCLSVNGDLLVKNISAGKIKLEGRVSSAIMYGKNIDINGGINCNEIKSNKLCIICNSKSDIEQIESPSVCIKKNVITNIQGNLLFRLINVRQKSKFVIKIGSIKGESVDISGVNVSTIISKKVRIKNKSVVKRVICSHKPEISPDSVVEEVIINN